MNEVLKNLPVTTWYKALAVVAAPAFLISLVAGRDALMIIFGGFFLIALGEWRHYKRKSTEYRPTQMGQWALIRDVPREVHWSGIVLQLAGALFVAFGIYFAYRFGIH